MQTESDTPEQDNDITIELTEETSIYERIPRQRTPEEQKEYDGGQVALRLVNIFGISIMITLIFGFSLLFWCDPQTLPQKISSLKDLFGAIASFYGVVLMPVIYIMIGYYFRELQLDRRKHNS